MRKLLLNPVLRSLKFMVVLYVQKLMVLLLILPNHVLHLRPIDLRHLGDFFLRALADGLAGYLLTFVKGRQDLVLGL